MQAVRLLGFILCIILVPQQDARQKGFPFARIFASEYGNCGLKVVCHFDDPATESPPPAATQEAATVGRGVIGTLFRLEREGVEKVLWHKNLRYLPGRVFVSEWGHVVMLKDWMKPGYKHAIVVLDGHGNRLADYSLSQILTEDEIDKYVKPAELGREWTHDVSFAFGLRRKFVIELAWKTRLEIDMRSGEVRRIAR